MAKIDIISGFLGAGKTTLIQKLLNKLVVLTYYKGLSYVYYGEFDLSNYHFDKLDGLYFLDREKIKIRRFVKIGDGVTGKKNNICDVDDVCVSHFTVNDTSEFNTGLTVISPHSGNIFREKVVGASYVFNGFGKSIGRKESKHQRICQWPD